MIKKLTLILICIFLQSCDDRPCLKSHTETMCQCVNDIPFASEYESCDIYGDNNDNN